MGKERLQIKYDGYRMHARIDGGQINCSLAPALTGRTDTAAPSNRSERYG